MTAIGHFAAMLLLACIAKDGGSDGLKPAETRGVTENGPDISICRHGAVTLEITYRGKIRWITSDRRVYNLSIPLASKAIGLDVESVSCGDLEGDLIVLADVTEFYFDGEFAGAVIMRFDSKTRKARWSARVPGGISGASVTGNSLYAAGQGFIGKLNLQTGKFSWTHAPARDANVWFESPVIDKGRITFPSRDHRRSVTVDDSTGQVLLYSIDGSPAPTGK